MTEGRVIVVTSGKGGVGKLRQVPTSEQLSPKTVSRWLLSIPI